MKEYYMIKLINIPHFFKIYIVNTQYNGFDEAIPHWNCRVGAIQMSSYNIRFLKEMRKSNL